MLLTSVDVLTKYWPFGRETLFLCRVAKAGPCFAVYYSSFAVVAIAVDRHRCIVHSDSKQAGLQGGPSGRGKPPVDLVPPVLAAAGPLL